jgi:hypothetical protein
MFSGEPGVPGEPLFAQQARRSAKADRREIGNPMLRKGAKP